MKGSKSFQKASLVWHIQGHHLTHVYTAGPALPPVSLHTQSHLSRLFSCVPCRHTQTVLEVAPLRRHQLLRAAQRAEGGTARTLWSTGRAKSHATVRNHTCQRPSKPQQCMHARNGCKIHVADPVTCVFLFTARSALGHVLSPYSRLSRRCQDHLPAE